MFPESRARSAMPSGIPLRFVAGAVVLLALTAFVVGLAVTGAASANQAATSANSTTDAAWSAHVLGDIENEGANCVHFIDSTEGWAGGWKGRMYHTTDGGLTWKQSYLPNRTLYVKQVQFMGRLRGWALAEGSYKKGAYSYSDWRLYRTVDGGVTWKWLWTRKASAVNEFQFVDAKRGWFVGGRKVYTTSNGGATLSDQHADRKLSAPLSLAKLTGLRFVDAKRGWVCGGYVGGWSKPIMLRTSDGGKTWRAVKSGLSGGINDVWFGNGATGYAIGKGLYKTTNAGGSWRRVKHSSAENYDSVQSFGASDVRMIGNATSSPYTAKIFTSRDGGSTWKTAAPQVEGDQGSSWSAMSFLDADTGWVVGNISGAGRDYYVLRTPAVTETAAPPEEETPVPVEESPMPDEPTE